MKDITEEKRDGAYQTAPVHIREIYSGSETGAFLTEVQQKNSLPEEKYRDYAILIGDLILGFYQKSELRGLLESELQITGEVAQKIEADLKPLLSKLDGVPSIPPAEAELKEKLELRPEGISRPIDIPTPPSSSQPLTREAIMSTLTPKRTMANDIASLGGGEGKVHGYEAYVAKKESGEEK